MRKALIPIIIASCLGLMTGLYFHGKGENEREAPISASSKLVQRVGTTPILELKKENAEAAGIETRRFPGKEKELRLPSSAILREEDRSWIYLKISDMQYTRQEVEPITTSEQGAWRAVGTPPLPERAEIVTVGAQLLLSEELKSQIQVGEGGGG